MEDQGAITSPQVDPSLGQSTPEAAKPTEAPRVEAAQPVTEPEVRPQEDSTQIPTKFVGKTTDEIVKSYSELEKEKGRLANKVSEAERKAKELEAQLFNTQSRTQNPNQPVVSSQPIKSIEDQYAEEWEQDPKQAVINYNKRKEELSVIRSNESQSNTFYTQAMSGKLQGYEDFPELEPTMKELVPQVIDLVHPSMINHPKTIQVLHLIARGLNVDKVASQKAKNIAAKNREKEQAFSESSSSTGESVDFAKLPLSDMRKYLGYAKRTD